MRSLLPKAVRYVKCNNRRRLGWLLARYPRLKTAAEGGSPLDWAVCHSSPELRDWLVSIGGRRHDDSYAPGPWPPQDNEGACRPGFDFGPAGG